MAHAQLNLNHARIKNDDYYKYGKPWEYEGDLLANHGFESDALSVYFRDLAHHLVRHIEQADVVLGCVAWLTDESVLRALACKKAVSIVVQKEDFLRPDGDVTKAGLRSMYAALPGAARPCLRGLGSSLSTCADLDMEGVRCVGVRGNKSAVSPRSHHKFVLFCREEREPREDYGGYGWWYAPYAVWTGSFNFTFNGGLSLENAVVLSDSAAVSAFYGEYQQVLALSESLDWSYEYVSPDWRVGT